MGQFDRHIKECIASYYMDIVNFSILLKTDVNDNIQVVALLGHSGTVQVHTIVHLTNMDDGGSHVAPWLSRVLIFGSRRSLRTSESQNEKTASLALNTRYRDDGPPTIRAGRDTLAFRWYSLQPRASQRLRKGWGVDRWVFFTSSFCK